MGIDTETQFIGNVGTGVKTEQGEYTAGSELVYVPTTLTTLLGGIAVGEITDPCSGYAKSICEGPTIEFVLSDATPGSIMYMAWGW